MRISIVILQVCWAGLSLAAATTYPVCKPQLKGTAPSNSYCGQKGSVNHLSSCGITTESTQESCLNRCWTNSKCKSFSYNSVQKKCTQASQTVQQQGFNPSSSAAITWWDKNCYQNYCPPICGDSKVLCGNTCKDLSNDPQNCGSCGKLCPPRSTCQRGICLCPNGASPSKCSNSCPDYQSDSSNCGKCGNSCRTSTTGATCTKGSCRCPNGDLLSKCSGGCPDYQNDPENCGQCGLQCGGDSTCQNGQCSCPNGQPIALCNGNCPNYSTDDSNCGSCGNVCELQSHCSSGNCLCADGSDSTNLQTNNQDCGVCGNYCQYNSACSSGSCTCSDGTPASSSPSNDNNCGTCGNNCIYGSTCQGGTCLCADGTNPFSLQSDNANCGTCGNACEFGPHCSGGVCRCPDGYLTSTLASNNFDCGTCGNMCLSGTTCQGGICQCPDGSLASSLQSNNNDCGTCGNVCGSGSTCQGGACKCPDGSLLSSLQTNVNDCGSCGNHCTGAGVGCSSGSCSCTDPTQTYCASIGCIPTLRLQIDTNNCGGCGQTCGSGQICLKGTCVADPGGCGTRGLQWGYQTNKCGANNDFTYSNFLPETFTTAQANPQGTVSQVGGWTANSDQIYSSGIAAGTANYAINHRGWIIAPLDGDYTITIEQYIDDIACVWIGTGGSTATPAYAGYARSNANICRAFGIDYFSGPRQTTVTLAAGQYYALRVIYGQAQENTYFRFSIVHSSGLVTVVSSTANSANPWVITQGCTAGGPPAFLAYGLES